MPESDPPPLSSPEPEELLLLGGSATSSSLSPSSLSPSLPSSLDELSYLAAGVGGRRMWVRYKVLRGGKWLSPYP